MSQSLELPLDTKCYLCDSYYTNIHQSFIIYKCFKCKKYTPYCASCEIKLQKLFGDTYVDNYKRNAESLITFFYSCRKRDRNKKNSSFLT